MARITILMFPEPGHLLPTVRIARRLQRDGHAVTYVTLPCYSDALMHLGFETRPAFISRINQPTERSVDALPLWATATSGVTLWRGLGADVGVPDAPIRHVIRSVASEAIVPALVAARPDLLLCDAKIAAACGDVLARATGGTPIVALRTELPIGDGVPYPDIVLCPAELELPVLRRSSPGRFYCESSVFVDRPDQGTLADSIGTDDGSGDRMVFCSLGTQADAYDEAAAVLNGVVQAFAGRPRYRLIVAAGALAERVRLPTQASNVEVHRTVHQLDMLGYASLALLHGGLGGVKEAILAGVPMILIPFAFDQQPNAERVAAHGLGAMVLPDDAQPAVLRQTADAVLGSPRIAAAVRAMQSVFLDAETRELAYTHLARVIEHPGALR